MTITFRCPACHNRFRVDDEMRGQKVRCPGPQCRNTVLIPNSDSTARLPSGKSVKHTHSRSESNDISSTKSHPAMTSGASSWQFSKPHLLVGVLVLFILGLAVTVAAFMVRADRSSDPFADLVNKTVPRNQSPTEAENEATQAGEQAEKQRRDLEERERQEKMAADEAARKKASEEKTAAEKLAANQQAERLRQEAMEAQARAAREAAMREDGPFSFIETDPRLNDKNGQWLFELPPPTENSLSVSLPLCTHGRNVELSLCGGADSLFEGCLTKLELLRSPDAAGTWLVVATQTGTKVELGEYTLEAIAPAEPNPETADHHLIFRWRRDAAREILAAELLRWWPLQISVGDESAVFLQRSAYVSEVPLKWESFVNSQKIVFPRSQEIQAIELTPNSMLSFCIEIMQNDLVPQTLCMDLGGIDAGQDEPEPVETAVFSSTNFPLRLPVEFHETAPDLQESPLGFATLQLKATRTPEHGLIVQPKLELSLRLPGKRHLETFPSEETHQAFIVVAREPEQIRNLGSATSLRNIAKEMIQTTRNNQEFWHRQPLRAIAKKSSFEPAFMDRARASMKSTQQLVRTAERDANNARAAVADQQRKMAVIAARLEAGGGVGLARTLDAAEDALVQLQAKMRQAETRLQAVKRLEPDIDEYCVELKQLIDEFTEQHAGLLQDYDAISLKVEELLDASNAGAFQLRGEMSAVIQIPQAENGPSMRIRFIEASSNAVE